MTYQNCKQVLCNSDLLGDIPDKWKEEVPFLVVENNNKYIAFLYCSVRKGYSKIENMILVNIDNYEIKSCSANEIQSRFGGSNQYVKSKIIDNYTDYFSKKEKYEQKLSVFVNDNCTGCKEDLIEMIKLFISFFSPEQCEKVIYHVGESYIRFIQNLYEGG